MGFLSKLLGRKSKEELLEMVANGALLIDVRNPDELSQGQVKGAINIPLGSIDHKIDKIKGKKQPVVLFCASGMRSAAATAKLKQNGIEAYNGGGFRNLM